MEKAKLAYASIENMDLDFELWGVHWTKQDVKYLVQRDILLVVGSIYIIVGSEDRDQIIYYIKNLFEYEEPEDCILSILKDIKINQWASILYKRLPYSIGLSYENSNKEKNDNVYLILKILEKILSVIVEEDKPCTKIIVNTYIQCCYNRLNNSDLKINSKENFKIQNFIKTDFKQEVDIGKFKKIHSIDNTFEESLFNVIRNFICEDEWKKAIKYSYQMSIEETYSRKEYLDICDKIKILDIVTKKVREILDNFHINFLNQYYEMRKNQDEPNLYVEEEEQKDDPFNDIWNGLKRIESKYQEKIDNEDNYIITDSKSELCYEQGKYLEDIEWTDHDIKEIPPISIPYVTFSDLNKEQLKYYLYWRTCFKKGKYIITGQQTYYYLYAYELMIELGNFSIMERWKQFNKLYEEFEKDGLSYSDWLIDYCHVYGLPVKRDITLNKKYDSNLEIAKEIIKSNYTNVFEIMHRKSAWKVKASAFVKKSNCLDDIKIIIKNSMPKLEELFRNNGLIFSDFLVGSYGMVEYAVWPYKRSIWTKKVLKEVLGKPITIKEFDEIYEERAVYITDINGNIKRSTSIVFHFYDAYLSEYILKYIEMLFREYFDYEYLTWPQELIGALRIKLSGQMEYILSVDEKEQARQKKYISLYPSITKILKESFENYKKLNEERMYILKESFEILRNKRKECMIKKSPGIEEMIDFINSTSIKVSVKEVLNFYETMSISTKKAKAKILTQIIWNYWILHGCEECTYEELKQTIIGNNWNVKEKKFIVDKNYSKALTYLTNGHDPRIGILKKYYSEEIITDCIVLTLKVFDSICKFYEVDSTEILLGKWSTKKLEKNIYDISIYSGIDSEIIVNLDNIEIYKYSILSGMTLDTYDTNESTQNFIITFMKLIDNELRKYIGYKSYLKVNLLDSIFSAKEYKVCIDVIPEIINEVIHFVLEYNHPKKIVHFENEVIKITHDSLYKRISLNFKMQYKHLGITNCIRKTIEEYYSISSEVFKQINISTGIIEIDINNFDIRDYLLNDDIKETVVLSHPTLNLTKYYDIYYELQDLIYEISEKVKQEKYNPAWNYKKTEVMHNIKGLTGKDIRALRNIVKNGDDFYQWIAWIEQGKFIIPKNEPYVQVLFHLAVNRVLFKDNPDKCLVILSKICNYYYDLSNKFDKSAAFMFEWLKDFWLIYCPNISYVEFKKLLKVNVIFDGQYKTIDSQDYYKIHINEMRKGNYVAFFNDACDYKVLYGSVVREGWRSLLEEGLENVCYTLDKLWRKYGRDFQSDIMREDIVNIKKVRLVFYRCILLSSTKKYIQNEFIKRKISDEKEYVLNYDYDKMLPTLEYTVKRVRNKSGRYLLEYILKHTEIVIRQWLDIDENFKVSERRLYELYPYNLYYDNLQNEIIINAIKKTIRKTCEDYYLSSRE